MKVEIKQCPKCKEYTLKNTCRECSQQTITPKPAKWSPEDKFGKYRRKAKTNGTI